MPGARCSVPVAVPDAQCRVPSAQCPVPSAQCPEPEPVPVAEPVPGARCQ